MITVRRLDPQHPYPGLASFEEEDASFFRGRARPIHDLTTLVELQRLTVLYGKSGLGKTSLLQAGVFPRLRQAGIVPIRIRLSFEREEDSKELKKDFVDQVKQWISEAIGRGDLDGPRPDAEESLAGYFREVGHCDADGRPVTPVLVLDQLEELFTLGKEHPKERVHLIEELSNLVENRMPLGEGAPAEAPRAKVLISLREEFLADLDDHRRIMPSLATGRYRLMPLDGASARQAVIEPGREVVNEDVAEGIVKVVAGVPDTADIKDIQEVDSALLAFYCAELNQKRKEGHKIDKELVQINKDKLFDDFYDGCIEGVPEDVRTLIEDQLLTPEGRRDTVAEDRIPDHQRSFVGELIDKRLLRREQRLSQLYVEIVHDVLTRPIAKRRSQRQEEIEKRNLKEQAKQAQARLLEEEKRRIEQEEKLEQARKLSRTRRQVTATTAALVSVTVLFGGVYAYREVTAKNQEDQRRSADRAKEQIKASEARADVLSELAWRATSDKRWDDAARALTPAFEAIADAKTQSSLLSAADQRPLLPQPLLGIVGCRFEATIGRVEPLLLAPSGVSTYRVFADGRYAAVLSADGSSVKFVDVDSGRSWQADSPGRASGDRPPLHDQALAMTDGLVGELRSFAASGDGGVVVGQGDDGQAVVWRVVDGTKLMSFRVRIGQFKISLNGDGTRALVWDNDEAMVLALDAAKREATVVTRSLEKPSADGGPRAEGMFSTLTPGFSSLQITRDGSRVIGAYVRSIDPPESAVLVWDAAGGKRPFGFTVDGVVRRGVLAPDEASFAIAMSDGRLSVHPIDADEKRFQTPSLAIKRSSTEEWFGFHEATGAVLVESERALSLYAPRERAAAWEIPLGGSIRDAKLSPDGAEVLIWFGEEARLYQVSNKSLREVVQIPEAVLRYPFIPKPVTLRMRGERRQIVTATDEMLRLRSLGEEASLDRQVASPSAGPKPIASVALRQTGFVTDTAASASTLAIIAGGSPYVLGGLSEVVASDKAASIELHAWTKPGSTPIRALTIRGGKVSALDEAGFIYFGDDKSSQKQTYVSGLGRSDAGRSAVLALSAGGESAAVGFGSNVLYWDSGAAKFTWSVDLRREKSGAPANLPSVPISALAVLKAPDTKDLPRIVVGDKAGGLSVVSSEIRAVAVKRVEVVIGNTSTPKNFALPPPLPQRPANDPKRKISLPKEEATWSSERLGQSPHRDEVTVIHAVHHDKIVTGSADGSMGLFDVKDGKLAPVRGWLSQKHQGAVYAIAVPPKFTFIVSGGADRSLRVWRPDGAPYCDSKDAHAGAVVAVDVDPEGQRALSLDQNGTAIVWDLSDTARCRRRRTFRNAVHASFVGDAAQRGVVTVKLSGLVEVWSDKTKDGDELAGNSVWGAFAGKRLYAGSDIGALIRWEDGATRTFQERSIKAVSTAISNDHAIAVAPDGALLAFAGAGPDEGSPGQIPLKDGFMVRAAALLFDKRARDKGRSEPSEDGTEVVTIEESGGALRARVFAWSKLDAPARTGALDGSGCAAPKQSGEESLFAATYADRSLHVLGVDGRGCVRFWHGRIEDGKAGGKPLIAEVGTSGLSGALVTAAGISPLGDRVILGGAEGTVSVWEPLQTGLRPVAQRPRFHASRVRAIAFHPDGRFAITAGDDGQVWLWDTADGHPIARLGAHPAPIRWAAFRPDGDEVVTGGADGWVRAWATKTRINDPQHMLRILRAWIPKPAGEMK